tara:strand:- start:65 stop:649 length:585 start_codon:yes stop_codon:yes gene_type:complete
MIKKLKYKRLLNQYRYLEIELAFAKEVVKEYSLEFETYHREYCSKNDIDIDKLNKENSANVAKMLSPKKKKIEKNTTPDYNLKNIFKQLARKFHPDKIPNDDPLKKDYEEIFKTVTAAMEKSDWGKLLSIADENKVELKDYDSLCASLQLSIQEINQKIKKEKSSYSWSLFMCEENEECKENVVKSFLNHLFGI